MRLRDARAPSAPHRMDSTANHVMNGATQALASGNRVRQNRIMPNVPILSRMQTSSTEVPVVAFSVVSASQVCTGNIGALIAKAMKKPANNQRCAVGSMSIAARSLIRKLGLPASAETT